MHGGIYMGLAGAVTAFVLLFIHAIGVFRLLNGPAQNTLEGVIILVGLVIAILALAGVALDRRWGWPAMLVVFSAGLANTVLLYAWLGFSITLALLIGVTIFAMMVSFIAVDLWEPEIMPAPEVTEWEPQPVPVSKVETTVGEAKKRKSKKSTRKKSRKRKKTAKKAE